MAFSHDEERVRAERARAIGLFRYSLIREAGRPEVVDQAAGSAGPGDRRAGARGPVRQPVRVRGPRWTGGCGTGAAAGSTPWCRRRRRCRRAPRPTCSSWRWR